MKLTKRILALALCLMMVLSMSVAAFAAEGHNHTLTITNSNEGYEYVAYQIFKGDLGADGVLSNIEWGDGIDGAALLAELKTYPDLASCNNAKDVAKILSGCASMDDPEAILFASIAAKYIIAAEGVDAVWDAAAQKYKVTGLDDGYYIVINTVVPDTVNTTVSRYILEVVRDITVTHKGHFPTVDKKIEEGGALIDYNAKGVGNVETYVITGSLPSNIAQYKSYEYLFTDTLSKGLTYNEDMVITVNGVDVTDYFWIDYTIVDGDPTVIKAGMDLKALEHETDADGNVIGVGTLTSDTKVILTYTATVNMHAVVGVEGNPNDVVLEYDNNPNDDVPPPAPDTTPDPVDPDGVTPKDEVKTFLTELTLLKKNGAGQPLTGAEFTLEGDKMTASIVKREYFRLIEGSEVGTHWKLKDKEEYTTEAPVFVDDPATTDINEETYTKYDLPAGYDESNHPANYILDSLTEYITETETVKIKAYVGVDGYVTFSDLGPGTYTLTESVTPSGFNTIAPITFTVTFDPNTQKFAVAGDNQIWLEADNTLYGEIVNVAGTTLPSTGGMGTTLFYIFGGLMFVGAAVLLITKKRMAV